MVSLRDKELKNTDFSWKIHGKSKPRKVKTPDWCIKLFQKKNIGNTKESIKDIGRVKIDRIPENLRFSERSLERIGNFLETLGGHIF